MSGRPAGRPATLARRARSIRAVATAVAVLVAGGVAGALEVGGGAGPGVAAAGRTGASITTTTTGPRRTTTTGPPGGALPPGQSLVTGTVTSLRARGATGPPLTTPLEMTVPVRGRGGATFFDVVVDGQPSSVVWNGGTPLGLIGRGAIVPGRVDVTVDRSGSTWSLDGAQRILAPGSYEAAAPVAVGQAGLARPQDSASFTARSGSVVETSGGATVHRDPATLHLVGPGSLVLTGTLRVLRRSGAVSTGSVRLSGGSFVVDLTPAGNALSIRATLQGPLST